MRAADERYWMIRHERSRADRLALRMSDIVAGTELQQFRALVRHASPDQPACRRREQPHDRPAAMDDRDIDGVFVAPGQYLARSVERIDEDECVAGLARRGPCRLFLGNDIDAG